MKKILLLLTFVLIYSNIVAQEEGHAIKIKLKGTPENKTCYLAHFFGNNQYIKVDSAKQEQGVLSFSGKEKLKGGVYLVVLSPSKYYDFLVSGSEQKFELESDTTDFVGKLKITGSHENELLFQYRKFLKNKSDEAEAISTMGKMKEDAISKEMTRKKLDGISKEVDAYMKDFVQKNNGTFAAEIIKSNIDTEIPKELPTLPNGKKDSVFAFNYYKSHFFNNIDFADERMLRTPFLQSRLDRYFKDLVYTLQDSVIRDCSKVLALSKKNKEVYRYVLWYVTNKYENPDIIGLDGVFIHLAENYYLKDADWLDSTQKTKFKERVDILKPLQTGFQFPSLSVSDTLGREHTPNEIQTKYTVVYFYDPDCGHCKEFAPKLAEFAEKNKNRVSVMNISVAYDIDKIKKFISTYKVRNVLNLWDSKGKYIFRNNFDVYSTPTTYILDQNHRIIAKRIPVDKFEDFLQFYERQQMSKLANEGK